MLQITELFPKFDELHLIHGSKNVTPIYGGGQINNPKICLIFMNPTSRNVASNKNWSGIKAPWIGTKEVWKLLFKISLFRNLELVEEIIRMNPIDWTPDFAEKLYQEIANESVYITNIAKCTQDDARHLPDSVYRKYLPLMHEELTYVNPKIIITLGNQVSSVLLQKPISVSNYLEDEYEVLDLSNSQKFKIYPCYYPVGQGTRNIGKAMERITKVLDNS